MIKRTRNVLDAKGFLHVYEEYDDKSSCLVDVIPVRYVIMGHKFDTPNDVSKMFRVSSDFCYKRIYRYWKSPTGFPATWRELVGKEASDPEAIKAAKVVTRAAADAIINPLLENLPTESLSALLTRHRRIARVFEPNMLSVR